jgi:MFS family permease
VEAERLGVNYWKLWSALALSNLGDGIAAVAFPLLAATLTREPALVAGLMAAELLPWLLVGLIAGAIADRTERRRLLWTVNAVRAALLCCLAVTIAVDALSILLLYAIAFILGVGETIHDAAGHVAVPAVVQSKHLDAANGRLVAAEVFGNEFAGPPLGSYLFALGAVLPFAFNGGALATAVLMVLTLPRLWVPVNGTSHGAAAISHAVREGLGWLRHDPVLRSLTALGAVLSLADSAWFSVFVLYCLNALRLSDAQFGVLLAIGAVGGLLGGVVASNVASWTGRKNALRLSVWVTALSQLVIGLTESVAVAGAMLALSSSAFALWNTVSASLRQERTPPALLGRVSGAYRTLVAGAAPVGAVLGGLVATHLGIRAPFVLGAPVLAIAASLSWRRQGVEC